MIDLAGPFKVIAGGFIKRVGSIANSFVIQIEPRTQVISELNQARTLLVLNPAGRIHYITLRPDKSVAIRSKYTEEYHKIFLGII